MAVHQPAGFYDGNSGKRSVLDVGIEVRRVLSSCGAFVKLPACATEFFSRSGYPQGDESLMNAEMRDPTSPNKKRWEIWGTALENGIQQLHRQLYF
jgi:hypothetical protein